MSRPRAAISVATSTRILPALKSASAHVRAPCDLLPCIATAFSPSSCNCRARRSALCLVRTKTSTCCQSFELMRYDSNPRFCLCSTGCTTCETSSAEILRAPASTSAGSCRIFSASRLISKEKVAENSRFWRAFGSNPSILRTSGMNPMSSMRSASSSTRISIFDRSSVFCCT
jgi:hypothetical protein